MPKNHPATARPTSTVRAPDFIRVSVLASVLFLATACGGTPAPEGAPASSVHESSAQSSSVGPTAADGNVPAPTTAPSVSTAPAAGGKAVPAGNVRPASAAQALHILAGLPVKGRAPKTGYSRAQFGPAWSDVDRNGCDTRNDILGRDLTAKTYKPGTRNCLVLTGVLADPYTSKTIDFVRGPNSAVVQIDHVVALSDAWQKGAQQLSGQQRTAFANDPANLLAVDGRTNQQKGDGDAATWLPPNKGYRCEYVARQISVKAAYRLWVTQAEHDAMARILGGCADAGVPSNATPVAKAPVVPAPAPAAKPAAPAAKPVPAPAAPAPAPAAPAPAPAPAPVVQPPASVYYQNCAAVRAAGAAPIHPGDPGFQSKFDRDGDGVGCE